MISLNVIATIIKDAYKQIKQFFKIMKWLLVFGLSFDTITSLWRRTLLIVIAFLLAWRSQVWTKDVLNLVDKAAKKIPQESTEPLKNYFGRFKHWLLMQVNLLLDALQPGPSAQKMISIVLTDVLSRISTEYLNKKHTKYISIEETILDEIDEAQEKNKHIFLTAVDQITAWISYILTPFFILASTYKLAISIEAYLLLSYYPIACFAFNAFLAFAAIFMVIDGIKERKQESRFNVTSRVLIALLQQFHAQEQKNSKYAVHHRNQHDAKNWHYYLKISTLIVLLMLSALLAPQYLKSMIKMTPYAAFLFKQGDFTFYLLMSLTQGLLTYFLFLPFLPLLISLILPYYSHAATMLYTLFYISCGLSILSYYFSRPDFQAFQRMIDPNAINFEQETEVWDADIQKAAAVLTGLTTYSKFKAKQEKVKDENQGAPQTPNLLTVL